MSIEEIYIICKKYNIKNYTINDDLSIDVNGDVFLFDKNLKELPLRFRKVSGHFYCSANDLTSLEGAPSSVGDLFDCSWNQLTSLEGAPNYVGHSFYCHDNYLTSLEGALSSVGDFFDCDNNPLESLKGIPLNLTINKLSLPKKYTDSDYLIYCRDLKFKKLLK